MLQETVRYIESLERRLLAQVHCAGLPPQLAKLQQKSEDSSGPPAAAALVAGTTAAADEPTRHRDDEDISRLRRPRCEARASSETPPQSGVELLELRSLLHTRLQPILMQKLEKQRSEDQTNIDQLLREAGGTQPAIQSHPSRL